MPIQFLAVGRSVLLNCPDCKACTRTRVLGHIGRQRALCWYHCLRCDLWYTRSYVVTDPRIRKHPGKKADTRPNSRKRARKPCG